MFSSFFEFTSSLAIECKRCVFPKPTPPYIIRGLKSADPGAFATFFAAFFAKILFGPSIKEEKAFAGFILLLFPALLCFVVSSLSNSTEVILCSDWGAIETLSWSFSSTSFKEEDMISW